MKLHPILINSVSQTFTQNKNIVQKDNYQTKPSVVDLNKMPYYVDFKGKSEDEYDKAKKYLEYTKSKFSKNKLENLSLYYFDIDRLEGIQKGIKVFEGLNFKQIAFMLGRLSEVATFRGCYNNCAHCYAEAKHPIKEHDEMISRMDWEDFTDLCDGIKEINERLGFSISRNPDSYITSFHDADCSQVRLKDKDGKIHDWYEIAKYQYDATGRVQLFDTAGWYIQDKGAQERVESYIQKILNDDETEFIINISANPYHAMHFRAVEHMRAGNPDKEEYFRKKDSERMANVLFTMTPLLNADKENVEFRFITRAMDNKAKNSKGLTVRDLFKTYDRYFADLKKLYLDDYSSEQKYIKNLGETNKNLNKYEKTLRADISPVVSVTNKLKDIYDENHNAVKETKSYQKQNPEEIDLSMYVSVIDANGKVYLTNYYETYETDIQLNFKNKDKTTAPLAPTLCDKKFTSDLIKTKR